MKRSQVAMESLMVYGIAILIVMLAVGALIYFGVLDLGSYLPDQCDLKGSEIECVNYNLVSDGAGSGAGTLDIELRNNAGKNIASASILIVGEGDQTDVFECPDSGTPEELTNKNDDPLDGTAGVIWANGDLAGTRGTPFDCTLNLDAGKKAKGRITLTYQFVGSSITRTATGTFNVKIAG